MANKIFSSLQSTGKGNRSTINDTKLKENRNLQILICKYKIVGRE